MTLKIYMITNTEETMRYIGSTSQSLSQRMASHRSNYRSWKANKARHCASFQLFDECGLENCQILLLHEMEEGATKDQMRVLEHRYISQLKCVNKYAAFRSEEERLEYNRTYSFKYRDDHREDLNTRARTKFTCECGCEVTYRNVATHRKSQKHQRLLANLPATVL